jgi:hypothetical protein
MKRKPIYRLYDVFGNVVCTPYKFDRVMKKLRQSLLKPTIYSKRGRRHVVFYLENGVVKCLIGNFGESRKSVEERAIRLFRASDIARRVRRHV